MNSVQLYDFRTGLIFLCWATVRLYETRHMAQVLLFLVVGGYSEHDINMSSPSLLPNTLIHLFLLVFCKYGSLFLP